MQFPTILIVGFLAWFLMKFFKSIKGKPFINELLEISKTNSKIAINYEQHIEIIVNYSNLIDIYYDSGNTYYYIFGMRIFIKNQVNFGTYWDEKTFNKLMVLIWFMNLINI